MYVDTHCHISSDDYENIDELISNNRNANVEKIIISGCTQASIVESIEISKKHNDVYLSIGYHPSEASVVGPGDLKFLEIAISDDKVVAIGEIGLDYHYGADDKALQIDLFEKQLALAEKYNLPVVIHSRDATVDTINILKKYKLRGDIHCFSGSLETAKIYINMGYYLGIGGVVTFKNSNLSKVIKEIGIDNILLETDSPYLAPEPVRGTKNSSRNLVYISKKIAEILNISEEKVADITTSNASNLFDL